MGLAAGAGRRLRPLTRIRPKALCPVNNRPLLDYALERLDRLGLTGRDAVAVNAHHLADQVTAYVSDRVHLSVETPEALGTAGAIGALRSWIDGRDIVVTNADAYVTGDVTTLLAGWDRVRVRLLVVPGPRGSPLGPWAYAGMCALPGAVAASLEATPSGLYEVCWAPALERGAVELIALTGTFIDCGTPADYLAANLHSSGGRSVVGAGATVEGELVRSVVWPGESVERGERLVDAIRAGGYTVHAVRTR